jgi:hypothetical protein
MGTEKDLLPGEELVACFRPFQEHLVGSDLASKIIQKHVDNLWSLGGEIIRDLNEDPSLRSKPIEQTLADRIDEEGGPLVYAMESEEPLQRSLDSTCRKLYRFLSPSPRCTRQITHRFRRRGFLFRPRNPAVAGSRQSSPIH